MLSILFLLTSEILSEFVLFIKELSTGFYFTILKIAFSHVFTLKIFSGDSYLDHFMTCSY